MRCSTELADGVVDVTAGATDATTSVQTLLGASPAGPQAADRLVDTQLRAMIAKHNVWIGREVCAWLVLARVLERR